MDGSLSSNEHGRGRMSITKSCSRPIPALVWWVRLLLSVFSIFHSHYFGRRSKCLCSKRFQLAGVFALQRLLSFLPAFTGCPRSLPFNLLPTIAFIAARSLSLSPSPESNSRLAVGVWNITLTLDERGGGRGGGGSLKKNTHVVAVRRPRQ